MSWVVDPEMRREPSAPRTWYSISQCLRPRRLTLTPTDLPSLSAERVNAGQLFELVTLTPAIRSERGLSREQGALIVDISDAARRFNLREGDLIIAINRYAVRSAEEAVDLLRRFQELRGQVVVRLLVERPGRGETYSTFFYL